MINSALMNVMTAAAIKAGRGLKRDFGEVENLQVSRQGAGRFRHHRRQEVGKDAVRGTSKARPGYGFVLEEGGVVEGSDKSHTWHIDPLDGTTNFLHGLPIFAISIGLEREGQIVAAWSTIPRPTICSSRKKGKAPIDNNRRMRVAARRDMAEG